MSDFDNKSSGPRDGKHQGWWQAGYAKAKGAAGKLRQSPKWRWMLPWTLAAIGVAVTIAWIFQPSPQPQFGVRQRGAGVRAGGPGGGPGGFRGGGGGRPGMVADATKARRAPGEDQGTAVGAAVASIGDIDLILNALGTVTPAAVVTVRPQIGGQLQQIGFKEGQVVHEGDFLAQIDPRPHELQLRTAQATLARDKVMLENAQRDLVRYQTLLDQNAASPQQVDTQKAAVAQFTAAVANDQVQIDTARLNLTYCRILAPITGRIGLRPVDAGNYVTAGDANGIGTITQLSPITALFTIPEDSLPQIQARLRQGATLEVDAYDRTNTNKLAAGHLASLDNLIDVSTGTLKLRGIFNNEDGTLFPNQFINIRLLVDTVHNAIVLPPSAIQHGAPGAYVFLIKPDDTVAIQPVKTGASNAGMVQVLTGVQPGDQVVIDGIDRMREGTQVYVPNPPVDATKVDVTKTVADQAPKGAAAPNDPAAPKTDTGPAAASPETTPPAGERRPPGARRRQGAGGETDAATPRRRPGATPGAPPAAPPAAATP
ncbi:MAG: efflux RND transporter periplasmic adaptor subunit [Rhodospirillaceae bacterium]